MIRKEEMLCWGDVGENKGSERREYVTYRNLKYGITKEDSKGRHVGNRWIVESEEGRCGNREVSSRL